MALATRFAFASIVLATLLVVTSRPSIAAWPSDPMTNLLVCNASNAQDYPMIVSDGAGGAIITWEDARRATSYSYDIYAQHVLASGVVDPAWTGNGTVLCGTGAGFSPRIVSDGAGGAVVTWTDFRSSTSYDIYAQHVLASGAVDAVWTAANGNANGTPLCTNAGDQSSAEIISDGAGGAIVAWQDDRSRGFPNFDIYAQHVLASGVVDPAWTAANGNADGTPVCVAANTRFDPMLVSDGAGGAIVTWEDHRNTLTTGIDIFAQHLMASGVVDPAWNAANGSAGGVPVCIAAGAQFSPEIVSDGAGGAIITWEDIRNGDPDIYARHVLASGVMDPAWTANGTLLCGAVSNQFSLTIISDGAGGAIVSWADGRSDLPNADIYAQHVLASGVVDPAWTAANGNSDGTPLCTAAGDQDYPIIVPDGAGGAVVTWLDGRSGIGYDIYAQHVRASGVVDPAWPTNGRAVCTAPNDQQGAEVAATGSGGAIITWYDDRDHIDTDIYVQYVRPDGGLGGDEVSVPGETMTEFALWPPRPNPTDADLTVEFALQLPGEVTLRLYDIGGRVVRVLVAGNLPAGRRSVRWNRRLSSGELAPAGVYLCELQAGTQKAVQRVVLLK